MCKCNPSIKTPFCGKGDCVWPDKKKKPDVRELLKEEERKLFEETFKKNITDGLKKTSESHSDLDLNLLLKLVQEKKRKTYFYVCSSDHLPDDCMCIIYLRPEDAKRFEKNDQ